MRVVTSSINTRVLGWVGYNIASNEFGGFFYYFILFTYFVCGCFVGLSFYIFWVHIFLGYFFFCLFTGYFGFHSATESSFFLSFVSTGMVKLAHMYMYFLESFR